ncbi:MAG: GTP-binding protein [Alicyclobacillus sp.]|nr:GTP-binding protein [Alicyclobacillus sp.]
MKTDKIPVFVVTGFLGSGKTTLLQKMLRHNRWRNSALIVNEFGQASIDHHLLNAATEELSLIGGGCACCQKREDLTRELSKLINREDPQILTGVVIETTGLADPAPIVFTILTDPMLQHHFRIGGILTTVDSVNYPRQTGNHPELSKQISLADVIVVTKHDLIDSATEEQVFGRIRASNPTAKIFASEHGNMDFDALFAALDWSAETSGNIPPYADTADGHLENSHIAQTETQSVSISFDGPIDWSAFGVWLSMLLFARGEHVLRVKGMLDVGDDGPVVLNGVQHIIHPPEHLSDWSGHDRQTRITFILRGIQAEEMLNSLQAFRHLLGARPVLLNA